MGASLDIEITGVEPAADGQAGYALERFVFRLGGRSHAVAVEMFMIDRRLQGVIQKWRPVPDPVCLVDLHMIHLYREPNVQRRMPDICINIGTDAKGIRLFSTVLQKIDTRVFNGAEIECLVVVSQIPAPGLNRASQ